VRRGDETVLKQPLLISQPHVELDLLLPKDDAAAKEEKVA
jgi:hypothetical protein